MLHEHCSHTLEPIVPFYTCRMSAAASMSIAFLCSKTLNLREGLVACGSVARTRLRGHQLDLRTFKVDHFANYYPQTHTVLLR